MMTGILKVRFESYKKAKKIDESVTSFLDMGDEYDDNSIILAAFLGTKIVGTIRIVFSKNESLFPFEKIFPFPQKITRDNLVEVSRLAILPEYQGSDIILKLFQGFATEYMSKKRYALCMATKKIAPYYTSIGAKRISEEKTHPVLLDESLTCYLFDVVSLEKGKMSGTAWYLFAREVIDHMSKFGVTRKPRYSPRLHVVKKLEEIYLYFKKRR